MDTKAMDGVLAQLRTAAALAAGKPRTTAVSDAASRADFAAMLKSSLDHVNGMQHQAQGLARAFESGAPEVKLHDVVISLQKAGVSFQQTVQVRNRMVAAYQEIMNLQV